MSESLMTSKISAVVWSVAPSPRRVRGSGGQAALGDWRMESRECAQRSAAWGAWASSSFCRALSRLCWTPQRKPSKRRYPPSQDAQDHAKGCQGYHTRADVERGSDRGSEAEYAMHHSAPLMSESGHFSQIDPLPTLSACPLRPDRVRTFAQQRIGSTHFEAEAA